MILDLINELIRIDDRLEPIEIKFFNIKFDNGYIKLIYKDIECLISKNLFTIYSCDDDKIVYHLIYSNEYTKIFDLIMLLYNNKEKITEIVLKYL